MKGSILSSIGMLIFGFMFAPIVLGDCTCHAPDKTDSTRWGGNEMVVMVEERSYRELRGKIQTQDSRTVEGALVEVFDKPEYLLSTGPNPSHSPEQKRLAACRTTADGKFCFRNLPSGTYELRSSVSTGWNVTHIHIVLDKQAGQNKAIVVTMRVGT
jgi:protocatechuate 3,4-dioxygenase beta subunit